MNIGWRSKYDEYVQRGLPHVHKDGTFCQCRECRDAIDMGLSHAIVIEPRTHHAHEMLYAEPDWKPTQ